jgi:hypothetical protein
MAAMRIHEYRRTLGVQTRQCRHENMAILRQWKHALQRRGQRRRLSWERLGNGSWFELPFARNMHPTV